MSTIIMMPSRPTTQNHVFKSLTADGREMVITVTAAVDISAEAVLADVRRTFPSGTKIEPAKDEYFGFGEAMLAWIGVLILLGVVFFLGAVVSEAAGFISMGYDPTTWPDWLPLVGNQTVAAGLVRVWLLAVPVVLFVFLGTWASQNKPG